ncbi:MAG: HAD family phosphatase [Proteobacteria bacterium]|nr:HAD family phosphatase [Pseudomonadota bacterium]
MHLSKNHTRAVIFDLDGVVLDSMPSHVAAWVEAFAEMDFELEPDFVYLHEGSLDVDRLCRLLGTGEREMTPKIFDRLLQRARRIYIERYAERVEIFPGAASLIDRIREARMSMALVTSSVRQVLAAPLLDWLEDRFDILVTGDIVRQFKPHPEPYLTALRLLGRLPEEVVVLENAPAGIESARRAGLTCLALTTTLPPEALSEADGILSNHDEMARWLGLDS